MTQRPREPQVRSSRADSLTCASPPSERSARQCKPSGFPVCRGVDEGPRPAREVVDCSPVLHQDLELLPRPLGLVPPQGDRPDGRRTVPSRWSSPSDVSLETSRSPVYRLPDG